VFQELAKQLGGLELQIAVWHSNSGYFKRRGSAAVGQTVCTVQACATKYRLQATFSAEEPVHVPL
jgi:hypothetical protein